MIELLHTTRPGLDALLRAGGAAEHAEGLLAQNGDACRLVNAAGLVELVHFELGGSTLGDDLKRLLEALDGSRRLDRAVGRPWHEVGLGAAQVCSFGLAVGGAGVDKLGVAGELILRVQGADVSVGDRALLERASLGALDIICSIKLADISADVHFSKHAETLSTGGRSQDVLRLESEGHVATLALRGQHLRLVALDFTIGEGVAVLVSYGI